MFAELLTGVVTLAIYYFFVRPLSYWKQRGIPCVKGYPIFGSLWPLVTQREDFVALFQRLYQSFPQSRFVGFYVGNSPCLFVKDPELIKSIFIRDFNHFTNHGLKLNFESNELRVHSLFNLDGERWREIRSALSPAFSTSRLKYMCPLIQDCTQRLQCQLQILASSNTSFLVEDLFGRYLVDAIAVCSYGLNVDSLQTPDCQFFTMMMRLAQLDAWKILKAKVSLILPKAASLLYLSFFVQKDAQQYFRSLVLEVAEQRKLSTNEWRDFLNSLLQFKQQPTLKNGTKIEFSDSDLVVHAAAFFIAGFETTTSLVNLTLLEVARCPRVQLRARQEILAALRQSDGLVTYEVLQNLTYLSHVIRETLRKYPPTTSTDRVCTKNYAVPDSDLVITAGTKVFVPIHAIQNDPKYFPHPELFQPERFEDENRSKNQLFYMPFGDGPRQCIGRKFVEMLVKCGLVALLRDFTLQLDPGTKYPPRMDTKYLIFKPRGGVRIKLSKII